MKLKDSKLFKNKKKWHPILRVLEYVCEPTVFWEWDDFGIMLRIFKNTDFSNYYFSIDIQIFWFNLWLQCIKKT